MNKNNKAFVWNNLRGQNPHMKVSWPFYSGLLRDLNLVNKRQPSHGNNANISCEYGQGVKLSHLVSLSPTCVRDLSGRVIHIGHGPEVKFDEEWKSIDKMFPRFSQPAAPDQTECILTSFRSLDMSIAPDAKESGNEHVPKFLRYKNPNLYPYKLRLDTFYIDGWKLPQTEYLYVKSEGLTLTEVESSAADFFSKWDARGNLSYEQWHEKHDGESWYEALFEKGVTVIPTFEAHNGYNKVTVDFDLEDFWPGRAVEGLHKIISTAPSDAPKGTILEVKRPGIAMSRRIEPAQVIVSDGSGYKSPHVNDPEPYFPDLRLPHTRCVAEWGSCHLPTHPSHFEEPALSGWDHVTGKFMQLSGPLWDPLHYYYKSVDEVVRAFKSPAENNSEIISVPEHMKTKFYPISIMNGYDLIDENVYQARQANDIAINSAIRRKPLNEESCTLGYHPLPVEFEYELDNWWFPELAPKNRLENITPPTNLAQKLLPVIRSNVVPSYYAKEVEGQVWWVSDVENLKIATGRPLEDYPFLTRYLGDEVNLDKITEWFTLHLEHVSDDILESSAHQLWPNDRADELDKISPGFYTALMGMRSQGLELMRLRHRLYREQPGLYYAAFWSMISIDDLIEELKLMEQEGRQQEQVSKQNSAEQHLLDGSDLKSSELGGALDEDSQL
jgi:hypothetical protein